MSPSFLPFILSNLIHILLFDFLYLIPSPFFSIPGFISGSLMTDNSSQLERPSLRHVQSNPTSPLVKPSSLFTYTFALQLLFISHFLPPFFRFSFFYIWQFLLFFYSYSFTSFISPFFPFPILLYLAVSSSLPSSSLLLFMTSLIFPLRFSVLRGFIDIQSYILILFYSHSP